MRLIIATRNLGKAAEFEQMLAAFDLGIPAGSLTDVDSEFEPEETGRSFLANAVLKATAYARHLRAWTLADDSGLAVDALGGRPGVLSARFAERAGAGRGDADNNAYLVSLLRDVPDEKRTARFICVLALSDPRGVIWYTAEGAVEGRIDHEPRGANGFGYDPLFLLPELDRTTAELEPCQKHALSHRGQALRRLCGLLARYGLGG